MLRLSVLMISLSFLLILPASQVRGHNAQDTGISPRKAADYIHNVIEAGRTIYSEVIVERLGATISLPSTENWDAENALPLPAQFLMMSSKTPLVKKMGMRYRLMSLWAIDDKNAPRTEFEKRGLERVAERPDEPYTEVVLIKGKRFFQAVYPDKAVTKTCVACHNSHPKSPKIDFKLGDVMGGILITIPLGEKTPGRKDLIPPEVVADYVHAVLESDRRVYSEYIVNRLQEKNIVYASENWWEENTLPLPAQFLLNTSELILNKKSGPDFKLISLWPINPGNGPASEFEHLGLEYVIRHPYRPFIGFQDTGSKLYFQTVYADFAVSSACVSCHNNHPKSPFKEFKLNDVMGGIVLTFPLE